MEAPRYEVQVFRDLVYSHAGGSPRLADLYLPQGVAGRLPVIVWVHGGGWRFGDRHLSPDLTRWFAARGFAMVTFDYRLSGEAIFPAPVIDLKTVIRWVRSVADQYGLDPEAIGLWGSSAGSQLSAIAALSNDLIFVQRRARRLQQCGCLRRGCLLPDGLRPGRRGSYRRPAQGP